MEVWAERHQNATTRLRSGVQDEGEGEGTCRRHVAAGGTNLAGWGGGGRTQT